MPGRAGGRWQRSGLGLQQVGVPVPRGRVAGTPAEACAAAGLALAEMEAKKAAT